MTEGHQRYCRIGFYRLNENGNLVHCGENDAWTQCTVGPVSSYSSYGAQTFTRDQIYQRDALLSLLDKAFEHGREAKRIEVLKVLGVPER
jgi:hypothetical protein